MSSFMLFLICATYCTLSPVHNDYLVLGEKVGNAFEDGKKLK